MKRDVHTYGLVAYALIAAYDERPDEWHTLVAEQLSHKLRCEYPDAIQVGEVLVKAIPEFTRTDPETGEDINLMRLMAKVEFVSDLRSKDVSEW